MRMLIVDDSRTMRALLASYARQLAFDVAEAADGEQALDRLRHDSDFDVLLIDWDMPRVDGLTLLRAVRAQPQLDGAKTMMVTSQTALERVSQALALGADDYLMKPLDERMFADKLRLLGVLT